jgi:O-antigen/teichoic acid export membrane protein
LSFVLRALFIRLLGLEYAGVNTLFADILNVLNLAELGFNNAILFRLYKTIADRDDQGTAEYITLYKKICYLVGGFVAIAGLFCIPFLHNLVNEEPSFSEPLWSLYVIVLATSVVNHLVSYKNSLIIANQERYITTIVQYGCIFLRNILQIIALALFKSIYLYLFATLFTALINGTVNGIISERRYNTTWHSKTLPAKKDQKDILKDVGALSIYKLCRTIDTTIDTFLISKFVDITVTAIYGSLMMILNALNELLGVFNDGIIASIGDLNASGDKKHLESVFYQSFHLTFLLYGICTATLVPFISKFALWWIGCLLEQSCIYIMLLNFLMYGFGMHVATFRNSMGIFQKGWLRPAATALLNLVFSFFLVQRFGLMGTLLGTLIARTLTLVWYDPWLVIHHGMQSNVGKYYLRYIEYLLFVVLAAGASTVVSRYLPNGDNFFEILLCGFSSFGISAMILFVLGFLFPEQRELVNRVVLMLGEILNKVKRR